jgi:hypothetical protein
MVKDACNKSASNHKDAIEREMVRRRAEKNEQNRKKAEAAEA